MKHSRNLAETKTKKKRKLVELVSMTHNACTVNVS